ncbi:EAL and HDOD domain-containing protein [Carboxydothermus ferrireducens]|uniref:EAL and modified HD-GYP domain-containing signal transduction protein n=1 Tax=Carboxydothermus ferrireducens DSM 11255 TaxID=1119529 RepID=A0ABX2R775_9THEO|nr:EAL domain-containing protein [Carboxydothermus ferrireducens]NYE57018.1 EAL and modified HD-GYP domain-containing signal transduction protein [Carboxydothermus ferrireducens DSM 11255]
MKVFVARQPIFDKKEKVVAYELLYRSGKINHFDGSNGDRATASVIINSLFRIGLENLTNGKLAFINFTENLLKEGIPLIFNKNLLVVEILEDITPDKELLQALRFLKGKGFKIALDDFIFNLGNTPDELLNMADIIKVDFLANSLKDRKTIPQKFRNKKIEFLAEKVETKEEYEEAIKAGYSFFQGYFFSKPEIVSGKDISASKLTYMQILNELNKREPNFDYIAELIEANVSLTYELLRLVNSAVFLQLNVLLRLNRR